LIGIRPITILNIVWHTILVNEGSFILLIFDILLPLLQLFPELVIGGYIFPSLLHIIPGFLSAPALLKHQICDYDGRGPGYSHLAVHEDVRFDYVVSDVFAGILELGKDVSQLIVF